VPLQKWIRLTAKVPNSWLDCAVIGSATTPNTVSSDAKRDGLHQSLPLKEHVMSIQLAGASCLLGVTLLVAVPHASQPTNLMAAREANAADTSAQTRDKGPGRVDGIPGPNGLGHYGPFATIRRAQEVVRIFQAMGYPNTIQFHNGDGYYVFPRR
jgi:hypothetical protein